MLTSIQLINRPRLLESNGEQETVPAYSTEEVVDEQDAEIETATEEQKAFSNISKSGSSKDKDASIRLGLGSGKSGEKADAYSASIGVAIIALLLFLL